MRHLYHIRKIRKDQYNFMKHYPILPILKLEGSTVSSENSTGGKSFEKKKN